MTLAVADTSALVSLGTVADHEAVPLDLLFGEYEVEIPTEVVAELEETRSYDDRQGRAAQAVLDRLGPVEAYDTSLDANFPLDDGENAAVTLANERDAGVFLCDEFNQLGLVHASLTDTRLVTTPKLLAVFVRKGRLSTAEAHALLEGIGEARSWENNSYVSRARESLK